MTSTIYQRFIRSLSARRKPQLAFLVFLTLALLSAVLNIGFIGSDEYTEGIARYLPAQNSNWNKLVQVGDVKSPTQIFAFHMITKTMHKLGVLSPEAQYRGLIFILGLISALLISLAIRIFVSSQKSENERAPFYQFIFYYFAFHFALIGLLARPMFESLSMPFVFLALVCAHAYDLKLDRKYLFLGVLAGSLAFCARPQTGIINLVFFLIPLIHRRWADLICSSVLGLIFFALAGLPDALIRGEFHYSLKAIFFYNLAHGQAYNPQPWWFYFPILFLAAGGLFLFAHYSRATWQRIWVMRSFWIGIFLFLGVHIIFKNKFERFLIPILPSFLLLTLPLWQELWQSRQKRKIRWGLILVFNFVLWPIISFFTPQSNILELCFYLNNHPAIAEAQFDIQTFNLFPDAFIERPLRLQQETTSEVLASLSKTSSIDKSPNAENKYWILSENDYINWTDAHPDLKDHYQIEAQFHPNLIEKLAFKFNPTKNLRRQTIFLIKAI